VRAQLTTVIRGGTVVTASDMVIADVVVSGETISSIEQHAAPGDTEIDATGCFVMPGGVDTHTHLENPSLGVTRSADDFYTGTVAALHGGTTTLVDFVKREQGYSMYDSFVRRRERAENAVVADIGFHPVVPTTAGEDDSFDDLARLTLEHGTTSWKFFMAYPGAMMVDDATLIRGMRLCRELGVLPMVHAENGHLVADTTRRLVEAGKTAEHHHHDAHTHVSEQEAVHRAVAIAESVDSPLFVVHVSSRLAADEVAIARARGLAVFGETCPQYLLTAFEDYDKQGFAAAAYICSPPIREKANQERLWNALSTGVLSTIGTDHAAFTMGQPDDLPPQKSHGRGCFTDVPNGVPGVEERLEVIYEAGVVGGRFDMCRFVDLVSTRPAKIFGMYPRKGTIALDSDADIVVWDPNAEHRISADELHHRADYSLYDGMKVSGLARVVMSRGDVVVSPDGFNAPKGRGRYLERGAPVLSAT
jgi:dihydropyrimidinase